MNQLRVGNIIRAFCGTVLFVTLSSGCVSRSVTIRSEPAGAKAYLDNEYLGETPIRKEFDHYGTRQVRLEKEGAQVLTENVQINAPWYQYFPFDLLCETLVPYRFRDDREFQFKLGPPQKKKTTLLERAVQERRILLKPAETEAKSVTAP